MTFLENTYDLVTSVVLGAAPRGRYGEILWMLSIRLVVFSFDQPVLGLTQSDGKHSISVFTISSAYTIAMVISPTFTHVPPTLSFCRGGKYLSMYICIYSGPVNEKYQLHKAAIHMNPPE